HGASFAVRRIEVDHEWRRDSTLPIGVQAAPVKTLTLVTLVAFASRQFLPQSRRLIGLHRGSAKFVDQQAGYGERLIANRLRAQTQPRPARQQTILRVLLQQLGSHRGRLAIGDRKSVVEGKGLEG